jgi:DNA polymerase III delta subunit
MIAVFYGKDDFSAHEALDALKAELDTDGLLAESTVRVDGASARPDELLAMCQTMPFLGARRLVVV